MSLGFDTANMEGPELQKLSQLRAKTDRQIANLMHSQIEAGLKSLTEVQQLLPVLNEEQRQELNPKLDELREALERLDRNREEGRCLTASSFR